MIRYYRTGYGRTEHVLVPSRKSDDEMWAAWFLCWLDIGQQYAIDRNLHLILAA